MQLQKVNPQTNPQSQMLALWKNSVNTVGRRGELF
jgi:hypothetical protein